MGSNYNLQDASITNLFKIKYSEKSLNTYNGKIAFLGLCKKSHDFVGKQREMEVPTGYQGGVSSGSLGLPNRGIYVKPIVTRKKMYAVCQVDRETIKAAKDDGAFVDSLKETVKKTTEKFNWNIDRCLMNSLVNGSLGTISSVSVVTASSVWDCVITDATWKRSNWEVRDYVNCGSGNTGVFEITAVTTSTKTVRLQKVAGSDTPTAAQVVFMQNSENNDIQSFIGAIAATSGTLYGVTVSERWQAPYQYDASSASISSDLLSRGMLGVEEAVGITPNVIWVSYLQLRKLLSSIEDQKYYSPTSLSPRAENLQGVLSFKGIQFMSTVGPVPIMVSRTLDNDKVVFAHMDHVELLHAPGGGWNEDEGFIFLRGADDYYEARYSYYMENYTPPTAHGYMHTLSVTG